MGQRVEIMKSPGLFTQVIARAGTNTFRDNVVKFGFSRKARLCLILATDKNVREHFRERGKYNVVSPNSTYILG